MEKSPKKPQSRYTVYLALAGLAAVIILTLLGWRYYIKTIERNEWNETLSQEQYDRHYVMITDDSSSALWQDIYQSAKAAAAENNAYLELLGEWFAGDYSLADYMNIAIAAKVDGIIVKPDGTSKMREAVNEAEAAGIPVVAVIEDETASERKSFVGVNSYQLGTTYGNQVLYCMNKDTKKVTVLLNRGDAGKDLVFKQLKETVQEGLKEGREVEIDSLTINQSSTFDAEEAIRDLFHDETTRPDILVCMNETDSECAYYAMVDYNQVGSVQLIGYYQSDAMLGAVQKGIIPIVITIDTGQMGEFCVEALEEYHSMGYVSSYFSVDLNIITKQNVARFLKKKE